ncbi:MAG: dimethylsulfonioproprionate lyase family protein, partial [Rhodospirillaceae bacterium]|nr:dimethylsulfonioproprionate lyase family protein [Rhodospirillaceae bacterium]
APALHWQQNPNYSDAVMGDGYMDNYGYAALAGGDGAFLDAADIRIGLLLIGPHRHYPPHSHEAEEVYNALASEATRWRRGDEDWRTYPLGDPIHHPPWMVHETETGDEALLALYCWYGESANAALVGDG